jgi:glycosidase
MFNQVSRALFAAVFALLAISCGPVEDILQKKLIPADQLPFVVNLSRPTNNQQLSLNYSYLGSTYNVSGVKRVKLVYTISNSSVTNKLTVAFDGYPLTIIQGDNFFIEYGKYQMWLEVVDAEGLTAHSPVVNAVAMLQGVEDTTPPVLEILSPSDFQNVGSTFTVNGTVFDAGVGVKNVWVKLDTQPFVPATINGGIWSINLSVTMAGLHTIKVYASDLAGNLTVTNTLNVNYDSGTPSIVIDTPADGAKLKLASINVAGSVTVQGSSITSVELKLNTNAYKNVGNTDWITNGIVLSEGTNTLIARATAANAKVAVSPSVKVILDTQAPTVNISSPADGYTSQNQNITFSGTAADVGTGIEGIYLSTGGDFVKISSSANWSFTTSLPPNSYTIRVYSKDKAGNSSTTKQINITIQPQQQAPGLVVHLKKPVSWTKAYIHYWATVPGALASTWPGKQMAPEGGDWYYYVLTNQTAANIVFNNQGSPQSVDLTRSKEGWYKDGVWYDQNPDDTVPPTVSITAPADGATGLTGNVIISANASDNIGITKVEFYVDNKLITNDTTAPYSITWNSAFVANGAHVLTAKAYDAMNSTVSAGVNVSTVNANIAPVANAGSDIFAVSGLPFQFNGSSSYDPNGTIVSYTWTDGAGHTLSGANPTYTYSSTNGSPFTWTLTVRDDAGATHSDTVSVTVANILPRGDFREETIYFIITTRFYDGDPANNAFGWDDEHAGNYPNDPSWRGDFKGLVQKLDYIKALGFSAVWITPVVQNMSGYDYHGYHGYNFNIVDPRYESPGYDLQRLINECHSRGMKLVVDIVLNHSGNWGAVGLFTPTNDYTLTPNQQYVSRFTQIQNSPLYHKGWCGDWEGYSVQTTSIAGDCQDFNTENPITRQYLIDAYNKMIDMGVDAFRVDTVKHISRHIFNKYFIPAFKLRGGENFYIFGEIASRYRQIWNNNLPPVSSPYYTWKERLDYSGMNDVDAAYASWYDNIDPGTQPSSDNHALYGNNYHTPNYSKSSGMAVIDFTMHWNFQDAWTAWGVRGGDYTYNDATWNVTYVDSHDYAPDSPDSTKRFLGSQGTWAENLSLIFTFRGIPCIYYGSEIEFKKGAPIDVGPNMPLEQTGRAYFGGHIEGSVNVIDFGVWNNATGQMANTLNYPLAKHIQCLNWIRKHVPALQKGQYSTENVSGGLAFKKRFTVGGVDSFCIVAISGGATFNNLPGGTYKDIVTGDVKSIANGGSITVNCSGQANLRVYVLNGTYKLSDVGLTSPYLQ